MSVKMGINWLYEKRPLKKPKLGPPDVYPQDPKQKEDELTAINVKQGFLTHPTLQDEYGSARNCNINASKFGAFFSALLSKKQELNTFQDAVRKKPQITKDNIVLVTQRSKSYVDQWFKELTSNGGRTLMQLARKIPLFNKKEEVFLQLYDCQVPIFKACWFIKLTYAYSIAMNESGNKSKKRQLSDPSQEWTSALCKFLRELYQKMCENYHTNASVNSNFSSNVNSSSSGNVNAELAYKQWQYCTQLARSLFEEGLLDKHEFLLWILDLLEKVKSPDDSVMRIIVPLLLQYIDEFCQSELLSRRLAYHCAKKLSQLVADISEKPTVVGTETNAASNAVVNNSPNSSSKSSNPLFQHFKELLSCPHHRSVVFGLSAAIQIITLKCPAALVWHNIGEGRSSPALSGSPLDHLPCPPSHLPMPPKPGNNQLRIELTTSEEEICSRSRAVEMKWCSERLQQTTPGVTINRLLNALDALDRHCFGRVDNTNTIDTLYSKIFLTSTSLITSTNANEYVKNFNEIVAADEPVIKLLCEWAVTSKRTGEHRALVVAKLLEKRQNELLSEKDNENEKEEKDQDKDSNKSVANGGDLSQNPIYQNLLMSFLDNQAPVLDDHNPSPESKLSFANLVLLFGELIRCDVFSHDAYLCALISRGHFANSPVTSLIHSQAVDPKTNIASEPSLTRFVSTLPTNPGLPLLNPNNQNLGVVMDPSSNRSTESSLPMFEPMGDPHGKADQPSLSWDMEMGSQPMDMDDSRIDADLDKLLQHIKEGQQNNMNDQTDILLPDSISSDKEDESGLTNAFGRSENSLKKAAHRHLLYTTHFPLPQDETTSHDCNQRHVLLYGVGKARDDARHSVKKVTKEILKLFNRKSSMDISEGGKIKKPAIKEGFNFEAALTRFQSLSYFDQHVVISSCSTACIEMFNGVATGSSNYIPLIESIAFLFDLMEMSFDVHGLIEFVIQLLKELVEIESQLQQKCPVLSGSYCTTIGLYIIGVMYRYHNCLLVSNEETFAVFDGLYKMTKHVVNPADCSSAERCILGYLYDLYNACHQLRSKYHDSFSSTSSKIKQTMYSPLQPSAITMLWSTSCLIDHINNPKLKIEVHHIKQLHENTAYRYSFVCNALQAVAMARDPNRLNELSILCAELTARCSLLSNEWLGALKALCCSSNQSCGFIDVLPQVDIMELSIHDNLAVFTSILIARRSFSLQDFVVHCGLPSLLAACPLGGGGQFAEPGARLSCHLLLSLFRTSEHPITSSVVLSTPATTLYSLTSPGPSTLVANPNQRSLYIIKHPCDRYLLAAAHSSMRVEAVLTVLKAILVLGDSIDTRETKSKTEMNQNKEISISEILGPLDDADFSDFGLPPFPGAKPRVDGNSGMETASLGEFAKHALKQMCSQEWVHERCLREPELLSKQDLLLDPMLTHKQAQQLLQMICHPKAISNTCVDGEIDQKQQISKVLQSLDEWTLRVSWLQLQLMHAQCVSSANSDVNGWLDNVAKATIDFFQSSSEESAKYSQSNSQSQRNSKQINNNRNYPSSKNFVHEDNKDTRVWLVAPLISKLPAPVQGKILRVAANVLESGNWMSVGASSSQNSYSYSKSKDRGFQQQKCNTNSLSNSSMLLSHPPFLSLVLMCLKGQDEQRECLLNSLYSQLHQAVHDRPSDETRFKLNIQEGLQLRLSLVGGMFDMIQKSNTLMDWAVLLLQLISYGVVDPQLNYELFTIVLDMLCVLIHTTQATDSSEPREETRKQHQNLIKKLKKELATERFGIGVSLVRQLLPIPKQQCEVITCEAMGSLIDTKGNKIAGFDSIDKKQGLQVAEIQKVSPWELLEGHKNPAPLSWTWFGAVKIERKPLRAEENHHYNAWHSHSQRKPTSYYLEPPPLPPEDAIDPLPTLPTLPTPVIEKQVIPPPLIPPPQSLMPMSIPEDVMKRERDTPNEFAMRGMPKKAKPTRRRRQPKNTVVAAPQSTPPMRIPNTYDGYSGHPPPSQNTQQWYQGPQQTGPSALPGPPQQGYYHHQGPPMGPSQARYERPNSKAVLNSMLRARQPGGAQYINQNAGPNTTGNNMSGASGGPPPPPPPHVYQARQQMMMQRQMRPTQQQGGPMGVPQNQMYQIQASNPQGAPQVQQTSMHHMAPQTQPNYGGQPPTMAYGNSMQMQMDQMNHAVNQGYPQQQNMMSPAMRAQLHQHQHPQLPQAHPQQHTQHPQQFMQQRSQYVNAPNVTMNQLGPNQGFGNPGAMQGMPQNAAAAAGQQQHMRQQMLQRQLSSGKPQQHNPYQQGPY